MKAVRKFSNRVYVILAFIAVVSVASGVVSVVLLFRDHDRAVATAKLASDNRDAVAQIQAEGRDRRSQTCSTFESEHLQEVRQLSGTYAYLLALTPAERRSTLNRFVVKQLPELERNARSDSDNFGVRVPPYCDAPNVGLPEPDPVAPKRPKSLRLTP